MYSNQNLVLRTTTIRKEKILQFHNVKVGSKIPLFCGKTGRLHCTFDYGQIKRKL